MLLKVNALFISQMCTIQLHSYAIVVLQSRVTTAFFQTVMLQFYMHFDSTRIQNNCLRRWFGDHLLSTSVKFPKKLLPDTCAYQGVRSVSVSDNFAYVLNGGPFVEFSYHIEATHDQSKTPYKLEIAYLNQN